ncbi:unnamed protein product [Dicrocoelium dendriticum]|nr:unnamed protein product [Dicrocoelium dendriticum]
MPKCPSCQKEVYFAERVTSLGKDWHRPCLKCARCSKTLAPGSHSELSFIPLFESNFSLSLPNRLNHCCPHPRLDAQTPLDQLRRTKCGPCGAGCRRGGGG